MKSLESEYTRSVVWIDENPEADQCLRLRQSQILINFSDKLCVAFAKQNLSGVVFTRCCVSLLRNPRNNRCADRIYITGVCAPKPLKCCKWNQFTLWNKFIDLSMASKIIQTPKIAKNRGMKKKCFKN